MTSAWFSSVADRLSDPVLLLDASGVVSDSNEACKARFNLGAGASLLEQCATPAAFERYLQLASRSASPLPGALRLKGSDERWRCDASVVPRRQPLLIVLHLRPANEAGTRFLMLNEQIAKLQAEMRRREELEREREKLHQSEREARELAEKASRFKDELLAAVSHELRTPLHAISGWLTLIKGAQHDPVKVARGLDVIERNVAVQSQLTEDLVDASLALTGRMKLETRLVDLEPIIRQAVDTTMPATNAKQQRVEVVADVGTCVVNGDPDRLLQIVWNLLSNATKYTPKGGKIQVLLRRVNSHAEILVSDTGEGIAPDLLPHVFDRFRRGDGSSSRRHAGVGLGLAIVRHLVELHGGLILADSTGVGKGATFTVSLPMPVAADRHSSSPVRSPRNVQTSAALEGVRILLVEDHEDSRELLAEILADQGALITQAEDAAQANERFRAGTFDVVVSDIEMPNEDGFTLMRKLRMLEAELSRRSAPAIAVSAHSIGDVRLHALRSGYQAFMPKPLEPEELVAMVESLFHSHHNR